MVTGSEGLPLPQWLPLVLLQLRDLADARSMDSFSEVEGLELLNLEFCQTLELVLSGFGI